MVRLKRSAWAFILFVSSLKRIRFADYAPFRSWRNGGRAGISPPVGHAVGIKALLEVSYELRAIVFDPEARRFWQPLTQRIKGDGSLLAGLCGGKGDSEAGVGIDEGEQVSAQAIAQAIARAHYGIAGAWGHRIWQSGLPGRRRLGALFPAIKRSATDIKGITSSLCAMLVEETECFEAFLSISGSHLPKLP